MNKKIIFLTTALLLILKTATTIAQSINNEIQIIEGAFGIEKKRVIEDALNLSSMEETHFWPIYEEYENKRSALGKERLYLIYDYVIAYPTLTGKQASEITSRCFKNDEALARLHKHYYKKIKRKLSPLKASQFVQVEGFIENSVRIQLQSRLPFIGEAVPVVGKISNR